MDRFQSSVEAWIRDQRSKMRFSWPQLRWPWNDVGQQRKQLQEEYQRRRKQLHSLCHAVKAESVADLQDILCAMVLAECVYKVLFQRFLPFTVIDEPQATLAKKPAAEMLRAANKFKADFGGQLKALVIIKQQFSSALIEKDVIADANILQGAIFHEDFIEDIEENEVTEGDKISSQNVGKTLPDKHGQLKVKPKLDQVKNEPKPAAHRGFLARAKGIPALELYRLAQKKNRKLVLCGHSLGGAVAALATLAILRVIASSSQQKENEKVQVQCITFSQPPVGNAALKDYVHGKGWQHYFKTYCIPEDLVPRILSPAYFHHYNVQTSNDGENMSPSLMKHEDTSFKSRKSKPKENGGEQLVLGLGPVQNSFWRISCLVPLESVWKQLDRFKRRQGLTGRTSSILDSSLTTALDEVEAEPQSLEIQEGSEGISLTPLGDRDRESTHGNSYITGKSDNKNGDSGRWRRVPYLPSLGSKVLHYECIRRWNIEHIYDDMMLFLILLYLLGSSSVESLSDSEYSKLTSVRSVLAELRERFQSHSMKSYRSRFQKIYELCMCVHPSPFSGIEQLPQFPHLQQWLGLAVAGTVELGHIVDPLVIRTATSVVPLGWSGALGEKNVEPLKVDITGYGLHLCSLVQAQVNGSWYCF
ncbi:hypothetical protein ACLOJK_024341 [Asimina triloba]